MKKRIVSALLVVLLLIASLPALTAEAKWGTEVTDTAVYEQIIAQVAREENPYIAGRLRLLFYGDASANIYYIGQKFPGSSKYQSLTDGEVGEKISFNGAQCWAYAEYCFYKFFGTTQYVNADFVKTHQSEKLSASNLKKVLADARCGAHLRVGNTHSVCFVCENEDKTGFYYLDAIGSSSAYHVYLHYDTYQSFCDTYSSKTIQYLMLPKTYPVCDEAGDQLTIVNAKIPINVQKGKGFDVIGTTFISDCAIRSIRFSVADTAGTEQFSATISPNCPAYRVNKIADDKYFPFSKLAAGDYFYRIAAEDEKGQKAEAERAFTVTSAAASYQTENFYAYTVTLFDAPRYYDVTEAVDCYSYPGISSNALTLSAGTVLCADAFHTDVDETVWVRANGRWVREKELAAHEHSLSETGLCTKAGCGFDATGAVTALPKTTCVALSAATVYSRPYETESTVKKTFALLDPVVVTGQVTNVRGETWVRTDAGFLPAEKLGAVTSLSVVEPPLCTSYPLGGTFDPDGMRVQAVTADGSFDLPTDRLSFTYRFNKAGTAAVTVGYGSRTVSVSVTVLPAAGEEVWLVNTAMKVRSGPDTSYEQVASLAVGTQITVTAITKTDTYLWGLTENGWVAMTVLASGKEYCTYQSGHLFEVCYDANGGDGSIEPTKKASVSDVTITTEKPVREGYLFLGWATEKDAAKPLCRGGEVCSVNASFTLYAVWQAPDYAIADGQMLGILPGTRAGDFLASFGAPFTVVDQGGAAVRADAAVATGMVLRADRDYVLLVAGDVNGDGEASADDLTTLARHIGKIEAIEAYLLSCDLDATGEVGADDLTSLARHVAGIESL